MDITQQQIDFCLLIPCYNNTEGLLVSLKKVHYRPNQFLVVIVDDGSTIPVSENKIADAVGKDFPIRLLRTEKNHGITAALNMGLDWITGHVRANYIARLDCGDLCHTDRFVLQVQYLDDHREIGLLGSWCRFENKDGSGGYAYKTPTDHEGIIRAMHFRNVFIHPTVMFRTSLLAQTGLYPTDHEYAEDYALFWKMIKVERSHILDKFLVTCEINPKGISYANRGKQLAARWKVIKEFAPDQLLRISAFIRLKVLLIMPKRLALQLKKIRKQ
jgi:glycosyltransferase involved in cell wall biosynthesis